MKVKPIFKGNKSLFFVTNKLHRKKELFVTKGTLTYHHFFPVEVCAPGDVLREKCLNLKGNTVSEKRPPACDENIIHILLLSRTS